MDRLSSNATNSRDSRKTFSSLECEIEGSSSGTASPVVNYDSMHFISVKDAFPSEESDVLQTEKMRACRYPKKHLDKHLEVQSSIDLQWSKEPVSSLSFKEKHANFDGKAGGAIIKYDEAIDCGESCGEDAGQISELAFV